MTITVNPPGGVNLTIAIFALFGAALSIVGFIAHYIPHYQYAVLCDLLHDIDSTFAFDDRQQRPRLWQDYLGISVHVEHFHYLVTTPSYLSAFDAPTAWRLRNLRGSASKLKTELIALSQIQKNKDLRNIMEMSLSRISTTTTLQSSDANVTRTQNTGVERYVPSLRWWWKWSKTPQAKTSKVVDGCV